MAASFLYWTAPYAAFLGFVRILMGQIWYVDADGIGERLGQLPLCHGSVLWPLAVAAKEGLLWRGLLVPVSNVILGSEDLLQSVMTS